MQRGNAAKLFVNRGLLVRCIHQRSKRPVIGMPKPLKPPLAPKKPLEEWDIHSEEEGDYIPTRKCKSVLKERGRWSLHMAQILATFSTVSLKNAIKWGCLPDECFECVKTLQEMEATGVLVGKRRQYQYLAGLLRNTEPSVVEYILHSLENEEPALKRAGGIRDLEMENCTNNVAEKWFEGLMHGDQNIYNDIDCLPYEMFDREELKWLMKDLKSKIYMRDKLNKKDKLYTLRFKQCETAERQLRSFLIDLARRDYSSKAYEIAKEKEKLTGICKPFVLHWK